MTPLRQQMIDVMTLKGLSPQTQKSYLYALSQMARYFQRSPDLLDTQDVERYCLYLLQERQLAPASVRIVVNAVVFLFGQVLGRAPTELRLRYPKLPQRIPALLTREEVQRLLAHCPNERHYTPLALCYGTGMRVSELVNLRVADIDSARCVIHVRQGKGGKDRVVLLTPTLLVLLRRYWQAYRPVDGHGTRLLDYRRLLAVGQRPLPPE